jgi:abhydrolase domain-containing protein 1/3
MATIFLKYDRQLVECGDGGQVGLDWLRHARFTRPAPVPPPRNTYGAAPAPAPAHAAAAAAATVGRNIRAGSRNIGAGFAFPAGLGPNPLPAPPATTAANIPASADLPLDAPVFIMVHGINGGSHEGPAKWAMATGAVRGWRCAALNMRGCNGVPLTSAKTYCAASSEAGASD